MLRQAEANRGAGVWTDQAGVRLPAVPAARLAKGRGGMEAWCV